MIYIKTLLAKFTFVDWDRFCEDEEEISVYGWIKREQDGYKDFIVLTVPKTADKVEDVWYITSSAKWDPEICRILKIAEENQIPCQRVEWSYNIKNKIKLIAKKQYAKEQKNLAGT